MIHSLCSCPGPKQTLFVNIFGFCRNVDPTDFVVFVLLIIRSVEIKCFNAREIVTN